MLVLFECQKCGERQELPVCTKCQEKAEKAEKRGKSKAKPKTKLRKKAK